MSRFSRRGFMGVAAASSLAMAGRAAAMEPIERAGEPRLKLSLVAYSMRRYLSASADARGAMDLPAFIRWAAELGFDAVEPTSYYFPDDADAAYAFDLKRRCHIHGLDVSGGAIRNSLAYPPGSDEAERELDHIRHWAGLYSRLGVTPIRIFSGNRPDGLSPGRTVANIIENLKRACDITAGQGVVMAIENHSYVRDPDRFAEVIDAIDSSWFGITLDSANFDAPDLYAAFERFAPYAVNVHMKTMLTPLGGQPQEADLPRLLRALTDAGYRGYVGLEYEEPEEPYEMIPRIHKQLRSAIADI